MIIGQFHKGSGLGNQLARYVMTRVIAADNGFDFGMTGLMNFKGHSFMRIDLGKEPIGYQYTFDEERINNEQGVDIRGYDWRVKDIKDNTLIDGEFQGELYYKHRRKDIENWLRVIPLEMPDDLCIIGFRGGEYVGVKDLFLPKEYWDTAIAHMRDIKPDMKFRVVTDDPETARQFFPFEITHEIGMDWRQVRYAKYLIISNSSFYILPAWLNQDAYVVAPMFWAGRNVGYWKMGQNQYEGWHYL